MKVRLASDLPAPRSVVRAVEKSGEGRLRSASGLRERPRPARGCGIVGGEPSVVLAEPGKGDVVSTGVKLRGCR